MHFVLHNSFFIYIICNNSQKQCLNFVNLYKIYKKRKKTILFAIINGA